MITIMLDSLQLKQCDTFQLRNPKIDHEKPEEHPIPIKSLVGPVSPPSLHCNNLRLFLRVYMDQARHCQKVAAGVVTALKEVCMH